MIFTPLEFGTSIEENDIEAYKTDVKADKYLYLIAGTHGDEVEGVYVLQQLFSWLKEEHSIKDLPIVVVPILNVDGYRASSRVNAHAVDLNRNYPCSTWSPKVTKDKYNPGASACSEPENQFLVKLFDKFHPGLIISFHSWKPMLNYNGDIEDVAHFISSYNSYKPVPDIGYPTPGSLGTFGPERYGAGVLTYECPLLADGHSLKGIWEENEKGLKSFIQSDLLLKKLG